MSAAENKAVFLSYASQDADAARKICDALRGAGVEVWFDQSELRGGDAWDAKIRKQIKECALFVPVISANTQARREGYFRLEWRLADQRTHLMGKMAAFIVPVCIDNTENHEADVPDSFLEVQWSRLPEGRVSGDFAGQVKNLLAWGDPQVTPAPFKLPAPAQARENVFWSHPSAPKPRRRWLAPAILVLTAMVTLAFWQPWRRERPATPVANALAPATAFPRNPELKRAWNLVFGVNSTAEDFALAEDIVKAAAARSPTDAETVIVYAWLNNTYLNRGFDTTEERHVLARRYAERALQLAPDDPEAIAALGQFLSFRRADFARAEQLLRRAIELNPREPRFHRALGYNVLRFARPEEALPMAERTAELFPNDAIVHYEVGMAYRDAGRLDDMERAFDRTLAIAPIGGAALWKGWIAGWVHGDPGGMKRWLEQVPASSRLTDRALIVRYQVACLTQDPAELANALRAVQAFPGGNLRDFWFSGPKALLIGDLFAAQGKPELAKGQFELALAELAREKAAAPANIGVLMAECWTLLGLGRRDEAFAALRLAVSLQPPDARVRTLAWWFNPIPAALLLGDPALALQQMRPLAERVALRNQLRVALRIDPRMAPFREDPAITALIAEPKISAAAGRDPTPDPKSVAVLAFRQQSADPENEYLCEAISDELCSVLGRVPGLKVAASASAFSFKGKRVRPSEMAAQLGVAYLVDGRVQKIGSRVRVGAELIKAADESVVWKSDTLEHEAKDMFAVQDQVVAAIAKNLQLKLGTAAPAVVTINPEAYRLYHEGRQAWNLRTPGALDQAEALLTRSLALEPGFARALSGLADVWLIREATAVRIGLFDQRNSSQLQRIVAKIEQALALDPGSAEAHASLGLAWKHAWKFEESEQQLRRAIALNPNYASAHQWLGRTLQNLGRLEEAVSAGKRAAELDPLSARILDNYAGSLLYASRPGEALTVIERALQIQPSSRQASQRKAEALLALGRREEALAVAGRLRENKGVWHWVLPLARAGLKAELEQALPELQKREDAAALAIALLALGRQSEAIALFRSAIDADTIDHMFYDPEWDAIRRDPRIVALLAEMGLGDAHARAQAARARKSTRETERVP